MATVAQTLERLEAARASGALAALCRRHAIELLVLFGSAATRTEASSEPGDVDLALCFRHGERDGLLAAIDDLAAMAGSDHLDVMDLAAAGPVAMHRAMTRGAPLYEERAGAFAELQIFAINHYIETAPLRRAVLESLTR